MVGAWILNKLDIQLEMLKLKEFINDKYGNMHIPINQRETLNFIIS